MYKWSPRRRETSKENNTEAAFEDKSFLNILQTGKRNQTTDFKALRNLEYM
jgi:hypothetical protein